MEQEIKSNDATDTHADVSRRAFIKGVIGSGAAAFSAGYLFRRSSFRSCSHKLESANG